MSKSCRNYSLEPFFTRYLLDNFIFLCKITMKNRSFFRTYVLNSILLDIYFTSFAPTCTYYLQNLPLAASYGCLATKKAVTLEKSRITASLSTKLATGIGPVTSALPMRRSTD